MAASKMPADNFVPPASPGPGPPRKKTTIRICPVEPSSRLGLPYIPHDLIPNILIRLPPRSVARFRCVCKGWLAAISDPDFSDAHFQVAKHRTSLLMVPTTSYVRDGSPFLMGFYKYRVGGEAELMHFKKLCGSVCTGTTPLHCDGLILVPATAEQMVICNPATGELVSLPQGTLGTHNAHGGRSNIMIRYASRTGLGFDPRSNKYKLARFFYQRPLIGYAAACKFEVLTLGTNVWRRTADDPPYPIAGRTPVHVQGFIYWMLTGTTCGYPPETPHAFLRFSLADEKFSLVPCPPSDYKPARFVQSSETELCCTCFGEQESELEVWSLSVGRENPEWTRRCTLLITPDLVLLDPKGWPIEKRSPRIVFSGRMLILTAERNVYKYDMDTARMEKIDFDTHDIRYHDQRFYQKNIVLHLTNYFESLVRINEL